MGDCSLNYCEGDDKTSFSCNECGKTFCSRHRLPEKHHCSALLSKESDGKHFETGLDGKKDTSNQRSKNSRGKWTRTNHRTQPGRKNNKSNHRTSRRNKKDPNKRDIRHDPIEPDTVGTRKSPNYSSSPDTELKDRSRVTKSKSQSTDYGGPLTSGLAVIVVVGLILVGGIATGQISAGEYIGPPGKQIDEMFRMSGPILSANDTDHTMTASKTALADTNTPEPILPSTPEKLQRSRVERLIHIEVNRRRSKHGLSRLQRDSELRNIARQHSKVMAEHQDVFHTQPDGDTREDRYDAAGYECRVPIDSNQYATGGENVAKTWYMTTISSDRGEQYFDSAQDVASGVVNQLMNSTGHRENILRPYWENEGIGVYQTYVDGNVAIYVTQNFC